MIIVYTFIYTVTVRMLDSEDIIDGTKIGGLNMVALYDMKMTLTF